MAIQDELVKKMQEVCYKHGVSQTELAKMTGIDNSRISLLWNGKIKNITSKTYFRIKEALKQIEGRND